MIPTDTDVTAHMAQLSAYRRMGPEARVRIAARMSEEMRLVASAGIRSRHPDYSAEQVRRALFRLLLGEELVKGLWPGEPLAEP